jgi:hypothetical protein
MNSDHALCGWLLRTNFHLSELVPWEDADREPDIWFSRSARTTLLPEASTAMSLLTQRHLDGSWGLRLPSIGDFSICGGNRVVLAPETTSASSANLSALALGPALGLLCCQRQLLVLRATVVGKNASAALLLGAPGVGKSTTAYLLLCNGFQLISDGIAVIVNGGPDDVTMALPTSPALCLWRSAIDALDLCLDAMAPVRPSLDKYAYLPGKGIFDASSAIPIRHAIWLVRHSIQQEPVAQIASPDVFFDRLRRHMYFSGLFYRGSGRVPAIEILRRIIVTTKAHIICSQDPLYDPCLISEIMS